MTINYTYSTNMTIILDELFEIPMTGTLDDAVNKIKWAMGEYGFDCADVIDSDTGEVLIQVENS